MWLLTLLFAPGTWAAGTQESIDLSGYWSEGSRDYRYRVGQNARKGLEFYFHESISRCIAAGDLVARGTLEIREITPAGLLFPGIFKGELLVCNPEICVEAGKMDKTRWTPFEFDVSSDCQTLKGKWQWHGIRYKRKDGQVQSCWDSGKTEWRRDFTATRLLSCEMIERAENEIKKKEQLLKKYMKYRDLFKPGQYTVDPDDGSAYNAQGDKLADSWEALHAMITGSKEGRGKPKFFDPNQVADGIIPEGQSSLCWCETDCDPSRHDKCQDPWILEDCQGHEQGHCDHLLEVCQSMLKATSPKDAVVIWNAWSDNYWSHISEEITQYEWGIEFLEGKIKSAGKCY